MTDSNFNPFSLKGKTILVTGASSGIGKATAVVCSKLGASVILNGRNEQRLQETYDSLNHFEGANHKMIVADLSDSEQLKCLVSTISSLNGLALCAGIGYTAPFQFSTREKFNDVFEVNFFSTVELIRLLYKKKLIEKGGSVVTVTSMGGTRFYSSGNSIYGAAKSALDSLMKFCAKEFAPRLIRVNTVLPAMVETPLIHGGAISDEQLQANKELYPLKRFGTPEDIANSIAFLLSDASSWITGVSMVLDGGKSLM